jgi:glycosyltransferase involved in cell wall biosynthesis
LRVLLLNDLAEPVGGAEVVTLGIRDGLRARGHDARILASSAGLDGRASPADYTCFGTEGGARTLNRVANLDAARRVRRVLGEFRPDVVHVRMFMTQLSPLVLPLLRGVPSLYHAAWYETICPTGLKLLPGGEVCRRPAGLACRRCLSPQAWTALMFQRALWERWRGAFDLVVANSETTRRRLEEHGVGPAVRVYNGVARRLPRPPLEPPPTVAYAGRLSREKGVHVLVRAFSLVARARPEATLLLLGEGPDRGRLERLVAALGLEARVTMTGRLSRPRTERALDAAWVQAVPSCIEEPFGVAFAEALMRGTAVVASGHGGPAELIEDGRTGLLVPPGDTRALAAALEGLLGDRERAERMGAAGRELALARLTREECIDHLLALYSELIRARAA